MHAGTSHTHITYLKRGGYQLNDEYSVYTPLKLNHLVIENNGWVTLHPDGLLTLLRGYCWNGPSVPFFVKVTDDSMRASAGHDAFYQLFRQGKLDRETLRKEADLIFREHLLEDKMPKWRAQLWYMAVRKFAYNSSCSINLTEVKTSPA